MSKVIVTYRKSGIGYPQDQRATLSALGLKRLGKSVEQEATPNIVGMIHKVRHLVNIDGTPADTTKGIEVLAAASAEVAAS